MEIYSSYKRKQQANSTCYITRCHISIFMVARYSYVAKNISYFLIHI